MTGNRLYAKVWIRAVARNLEPGWVRIWLGADDVDLPDTLTWQVGKQQLGDDEVRTVRPLGPMRPATGTTYTSTGLYDIQLPGWTSRPDIDPLPAPLRARRQLTVAATWKNDPESYRCTIDVQPLPAEVPRDTAGLQVLLTSCFYWDGDKSGRAGRVAQLPPDGLKPDLVLAVGDQIYGDNPIWGAFHFTAKSLTRTVESKYRKAWRPPVKAHSYADVLGAGAFAAVPDDHEYWNNYPIAGVVWPGTWGWVGSTREHWSKAARAGYDAFQCTAAPAAGEAWRWNQQPPCCARGELDGCGRGEAYTHRIDVAPLSFFLMDNRTFRTVEARPEDPKGPPRVTSMRPCDLAVYEAWVEEVIADPAMVPVLVTGPSLLQPYKAEKWRDDVNFANVEEYPAIMRGVLRMTDAGCTPLLLTGDVHYPRVTRGTHGSQHFYEVISSPASVVVPAKERVSPTVAHPAKDIRTGPGTAGKTLTCDMVWPLDDEPLGNNMCFLRFVRRGNGVELHIEYRSIPDRRRFDPPKIDAIPLRSLASTATARPSAAGPARPDLNP